MTLPATATPTRNAPTSRPALFRLRRLLAADAVNVLRDPVLAAVLVLSIAPAVVFALGHAAAETALASYFGVTGLTAYALPIMFVLPAYLTGWVAGFLLIEDRDDGPLMALEVTPLGKSGFLGYRLGLTGLVTFLIGLLAAWLLVPQSGTVTAIALSVLLAVEAATVALVLVAFAGNKVEGLALAKIINLGAIAPVAAFAALPWRYAAAPLPSFWIGEIIAGRMLTGLAVGIPVHLAIVWLAYRLAVRRIG
ncbi:hypothetical protein [Cucumibacter marinus]|uniref:hypothetical protein n=1 Tax=Cucumibacter marinus TaxID=1121252 RepID=UPI000421ED1B|nr:hypothetical protein [Cucumibacter marinus]